MYILERFENFGTIEDKDVYRHFDDGDYSIEHIMPQHLTPAWAEALGSDYERIHETWLHRMANLTLTAYNSKYSNNLALGFINLHGYKLQREGQKLVFEGRIDVGIEKYKKAYPILKDNGIFLFYYGSALALKEQYDESSELLEQSIRKTSNPNGYILLGNNYRKQGK